MFDGERIYNSMIRLEVLVSNENQLNLMFYNIYLCYFAIAAAVFCIWFCLFMLDKTTPKNHFISWIVLLIAPLFWPIVLPLSIRELIVKARKRKITQDNIQGEEPIVNLHANEVNVN